ncbi:MAG: hypothetical protein HC927_07820 [Deltaproteobacteria bacterium]|nr:hypothetical protein [Deltaproteobacteria bacterium]
MILGGGLKRAIQRSILAGMGLALSLRGRGFALDGTMREFADSIEKLLAIRAPQLIQQLVTRQIISPEEAVE